MKTLITILLLLISVQASAYTLDNYHHYQQTINHLQKLVTELASQSEAAELTLNMAYRKTTRSNNLIYLTRLTRGFDGNRVYQHGYQYVCRQVKLYKHDAIARFSGCSELNYAMDYRPATKKALTY